MRSFSLDDCCEGESHDFRPDPEYRGEGYACTVCGVTEAELAGDDDDAYDDDPYWVQ